jgi:hypothetical protein
MGIFGAAVIAVLIVRRSKWKQIRLLTDLFLPIDLRTSMANVPQAPSHLASEYPFEDRTRKFGKGKIDKTIGKSDQTLYTRSL